MKNKKANKARIIALSSILAFILIAVAVVFVFKLNKYELYTEEFETTIEFNGEVNLDDIKIYNTFSNKEITSDQYQVVRCDDTSTVGDKVLIIKYKGETYTVHFTVKYKVEFVSDGNVISTQYVNSANEIVLPENPTKLGYEFISWDRVIPNNLQDNVTFKSVFSSTTLPLPALNADPVEYGTQLKEINLPSNENGRWVFVDDGKTFVGNVGKHTFDVKFVPSTTELVEKYSTIEIDVRHKELSFNITKANFVYDGEEHFPEYSLPADVKVNVLGNPETEASDTPYEYALIIDDDNYIGSFYGEYTISKAVVTLQVLPKTVDYNQSFSMDYEIVSGFKNKELLNVTFDLPSNAGTYYIGATINNKNIDQSSSVLMGKLVINKIDLPQMPVNPNLSTGIYGDKLSSISIENNFPNGTWKWKTPNTVIDKVQNFKAVAVFTPYSPNFKSVEREILLNINKKTLKINVLENTYTYNSNEHSILYQIEQGEYTDINVLGNISKIDADTYPATLTIEHEFYQGRVETNLIINKATPKTDFTNTYSTTWKPGISLEEIVLSNGYFWQNSKTSLNNIGTFNYGAKFVPEDTKNYETVNGQFSVTINKANASISNVKDLYEFVYTGNAYTITDVTPSHNESDLEYSFIYNQQSVELINAGDYVVKIVLPESTHYNQTSVETQAQIYKATPEVMLQTLTATYEDELKNVVLPVVDDGVWSWKEQLTTKVGDAGEQIHTVVYTPNSNNFKSIEVNAKILVSPKPLTFEIAKNVYTFNGDLHSLEYNLKDKNGNAYNQLEVSGNNASVNAGIYNLTLSVINPNYSAIKSEQLIINKATPTPEIPTDLKATYLDTVSQVELPTSSTGYWVWNVKQTDTVGTVGNNQFSATYVFNEEPNLDNFEDYTTNLTISVSQKPVAVPILEDDTKTYTGNLITANVPKNDLYTIGTSGWINVGDHYIVLQLKDEINYIWDNGDQKQTSILFTIEKATAKISNLYVENWTFSEPANTPSATTNFGTITYRYTTKNGEAVTTPTDAGKYYVIAEVTGTNNYSSASASFEFEIAKATPKISNLQIEGWTYKGKVNSPSATTNLGTIIYSYTTENGVAVDNPTNAGKYYVIATVEGTSNYNTKSESKLFEISKQTLNVPDVPSVTYTGNEITANIETSPLYQITGTLTATNKGDYEVKFTLTDFENYKWLNVNGDTAFKTFTISTASNSWTTEPVAPSWTYLEVHESAFAQSKFGKVVIKYKSTDDENATFVADEPINAGNYIAQFSVEKTDDYSGFLVELPFVINKAEISVPQFESKTYTGQTLTAGIPESNLYSVTNAGGIGVGEYPVVITMTSPNHKWKDFSNTTLNYTFNITKATTVISGLNITGWTYMENANSPTATANFGEIAYRYTTKDGEAVTNPTNAGSYYVIAEVIGTSNYSSASASFEFEIAQATTIITGLNITGWTYNETANTPSASTNFGTITYRYTTKDGEAVTTPTEGGSYYVIAEVAETNNYTAASSSFEFEIGQATTVITGLNLTGWTYMENANSPTATTNFGEITYRYTTKNGEAVTTPTDAGKYYVIAEVAETNNYTAASASFEFTIGQAKTVISDLNITDWTYNETANTPSASTNFGEITYRYTTANGVAVDNPADAGTYYVIAEVEGTNNYTYDSESTSFTIKKANVVITPATFSNFYLNVDKVTDKTPVAKNSKGEQVSGSWTYGTLNIANGTNTGSYELTFKDNNNNYNSATTTGTVTLKSVAKIGSTTYLTIESALAVATSGQTVVVVPDTTGKVKITESCTIPSGVTLLLPFGSGDSDRCSDGVATLNGSGYGTEANLALTNLVKVGNANKEIVVTNKGVLEISGELSGSNGGRTYAGHTARNYAELLLETNAKIVSTGEIKLTGFINRKTVNNSEVILEKGKLSLPFVLRDFRGGSYMYGVYKVIDSKKISAFNQYQFLNISSCLTVKQTANVYGYANLYAGDQNNHTVINFVGATSDYLIQLTDSTYSYLTAKYNPNTGVCDLDIYGGMQLNGMSLKIEFNLVIYVKKVEINTEKVYFPINWAFDISLNKAPGQQDEAIFTLKQKIKMMPGAKLTVNKGAFADIGELIVYDDYKETAETHQDNPLYPDKGAAVFTVEGRASCDIFAGKVYSTTENAELTADAITLTVQETKGKVSGKSLTAKIVSFETITETATFCGANNFTASQTGTYKYNGTDWIKT